MHQYRLIILLLSVLWVNDDLLTIHFEKSHVELISADFCSCESLEHEVESETEVLIIKVCDFLVNKNARTQTFFTLKYYISPVLDKVIAPPDTDYSFLNQSYI